MTITILPQDQATKLHQATPGSVLTLSGNTGTVYTAPDIPADLQPTRAVTPFDFIARFTQIERAACYKLAYGGAGDAVAADILMQLQTTPAVGLDDAATVAGMDYLCSNGCFTAARIPVILL